MTEIKTIAEIDSIPVLQFLKLLEEGKIAQVYNTGGGLTIWYPREAVWYEKVSNCILNAIPYGSAYPIRNRRGKVKAMVAEGLIDGCLCGCPGGFTLTDTGRASLEAHEAAS